MRKVNENKVEVGGKFISEVIFSTSEIEKTTSELVGFISDAVLWLLDAHRGKKGGRKREGGAKGGKSGL